MNKVGIITGITGQDGSYLAELLLEKGYNVRGIVRRCSIPHTDRIQHILDHPNLRLCEADMGDTYSLRSVISDVSSYDQIEIYNLAAQSHVHSSFRQPEYTADVNGLGTLRILECIRDLQLVSKVRFYQASTSELFGKVMEVPQKETTPFYPRSPYGVSKLYAYWIVKNYRESYGMFACNGILFNHESERRGHEFITRKISLGVAKTLKDTSFVLKVGNLDAKRDWGYAPDYVKGMWLMLQQDTPSDFILATGTLHSVREFIEEAFRVFNIEIQWRGKELEEKGYDSQGRLLVEVDPVYYRPCEVELLIGDASRAHTILNWKPSITFKDLVSIMCKHDGSN